MYSWPRIILVSGFSQICSKVSILRLPRITLGEPTQGITAPSFRTYKCRLNRVHGGLAMYVACGSQELSYSFLSILLNCYMIGFASRAISSRLQFRPLPRGIGMSASNISLLSRAYLKIAGISKAFCSKTLVTMPSRPLLKPRAINSRITASLRTAYP